MQRKAIAHLDVQYRTYAQYIRYIQYPWVLYRYCSVQNACILIAVTRSEATFYGWRSFLRTVIRASTAETSSTLVACSGATPPAHQVEKYRLL